MTRYVGAGTFRFVIITAEDQRGLNSLTNDIENVLLRVAQNGGLRAEDKVIYEDSLNLWDQVLINSECEFDGFKLLRARSRVAAMQRVISESPIHAGLSLVTASYGI